MCTGTIPEEIGKLTALEKLSLSRNNLSGETNKKLVSDSWAGHIFSKAENYFSPAEFAFAPPPAGCIPAGLGALVALELLDLGSNKLSGESRNIVE